MNKCPNWIFDVVIGACTREFIQSPLSLASVASKFQAGTSCWYDAIEQAIIEQSVEGVVLTLNDADAGDSAQSILEGFCYFRLNFEMDKTPRKIGGVFNNALKGEKEILYGPNSTRKRFKAYLFALRNGAMEIPPSGWTLESDPTIPNLTELIINKASILDSI